jgi:hypothetical protein
MKLAVTTGRAPEQVNQVKVPRGLVNQARALKADSSVGGYAHGIRFRLSNTSRRNIILDVPTTFRQNGPKVGVTSCPSQF